MDSLESKKYCFLQGSYWIFYCCSYAYVTYYMVQCGFPAGRIGLITAGLAIFSAFLQPISGRLADRGDRTSWKNQLCLLIGLFILDNLLIFFLGPSTVSGLLYGLMLPLVDLMMPLSYAVCFYYQRQNISMNFGIARGCGSTCYAVTSIIMGQLTLRWGVKPLSLGSVLFGLVFLGVVLSLPYTGQAVQAGGTSHRRENLLGRYPAFFLMLAGFACLMAFHRTTNIYLLQIVENVGGDSGDYGIACACAAFTELPVMFAFSRLIRQVKLSFLLRFSSVFFVVKCLIFLAASSVGMVYFAEFFQMFSFAIYLSSSVYYAERCMAPEDKITGQSLCSLSTVVGGVIGNLLGGVLIEQYGVKPTLWVMAGFASIGMVLVFTAAAWHRKRGECID